MTSFSANISNNIGVVQGTTDKDDIRQFQAIVDRVYREEHQTEQPHSTYRGERNRDSYILLRDKRSREIVGGVCLTSVGAGPNGNLPYEDREEFHNWGRLLPRIKHSNYARSQISSLVVDIPDYVKELERNDPQKYANIRKEYIAAQKERLIRKAIKYAFETKKSDAVVLLPKGSLDENELKDPTSNLACTKAAIERLEFAKHDEQEGMARLRDVYLLSTGSDKQPVQRAMYVLSNNEDLSRALNAENCPTPFAKYESNQYMYGGPQRKERMDISWASRIYPQGDEAGRTKPDAVIFDWDMVFSNYVPRYVAAANHAIAQIKKEYGIQPIESTTAITDVRTDVPDFINGMYIDNPAIKGRTETDPATGRRTVVPVKPGETPDKNPHSHNEARAIIAKKAFDLTMRHLDEHGLDKTGEIFRWRETLELLREKGIPYAVVSNGDESFLHEIIRRMPAEDRALFDGAPVLGNARKPDPKRILEACKLLGVEPSEHVWFVGDTMHTDVQAAMRAGVHPILFGFRDVPEIDNMRYIREYTLDMPKSVTHMPPETPGGEEKMKPWLIDCVSGQTTLRHRIAPERFQERFASKEEFREFKRYMEGFDNGEHSRAWEPEAPVPRAR